MTKEEEYKEYTYEQLKSRLRDLICENMMMKGGHSPEERTALEEDIKLVKSEMKRHLRTYMEDIKGGIKK